MKNTDDIDLWLKRFRASDAQEEAPVDDSAGYRALLGQPLDPKARTQTETKVRAQPETKARPQPETRARTPKP